MPRYILSKTETADELLAIAKAARELDKALDRLFNLSSGEMLKRLEDGNGFDVDLRKVSDNAKKLAGCLADEVEAEASALVAAE